MKRTVIINNQIKCTKCDITKDLSFFYKRPEHNSYRSVCNACSKGYKHSKLFKIKESEQLFKDGLKRCSKCLDVKNISNFGVDNFTKFKLTSLCKSCIRDKSKKRSKEDALKRKYKISLEDYKKLIIEQKGYCKICKNTLDLQKPDSVHLDHCHKTLVVRGVLCRNCNLGLGLFQDNINFLSEAINYLKQFSYKTNG